MNEQMVDLKPMGELDAMRNRAETAEMDARLAGEEVERLTHQLADATAERDRMRAALAFYADESNYDGSTYVVNELFNDDDLPVMADNGTIARNALQDGPQ